MEMEVGEMVVGKGGVECPVELLGSAPELGVIFIHF